MTTMSKVDIINDTVEYYSTHPRALNETEEFCVYFNPETKARCAVGRFSISEKLDNFSGDFNEFVYDCGFREEEFDLCLDPKVRGHSREFWSDLQDLHDKRGHWDEGGLSLEGQIYLDYLLEEYGKE